MNIYRWNRGTLSILFFISIQVYGSESVFSGQVRSYYMYENNQEPLHDYYGVAVGGNLGMIYRRDDGWNGSARFYTTHFVKDNVTDESLEPLAGNKNSRYVIGLVDSTDPNNNNVSGIGELNIGYNGKNFRCKAGRMKLETPFVNAQDGRMIPILVQGVNGEITWNKRWKIEGGYINAFWNRNTPQWKSVADSLGYGYEMGNSAIYSTVPGNYLGNTSSDGVIYANLTYSQSDNSRIELWNYWVENIFNLSYIETSYPFELGKYFVSFDLQALHEFEIGDGGNGEDNLPAATDTMKAKSYMQNGEKSTVYGVRLKIGNGQSKFTAAYNKTTDEGRFLFPREWGKEPLFTFQKRERSDGSGNCNAWLVQFEHHYNPNVKMIAGYGEYHKTDPKDWKYNKYGTPSYAHWNVDLFYRFQRSLKGLSAEYLMSRKVARGETYQIPGPAEYNFIFRKNGMTIHNLILNYDF